MLYQQFSFKAFNFSSSLIQDLVSKNKKTSPFISDFFSETALINQANVKKFDKSKRQLLVQALTAQNKLLKLSKESATNLQVLQEESTFTITTGHQLNLMTGPLYSIYKVAQVIAITKRLNEQQKGKHFVPVFWMATEDHDFEEINHLHLFGEKIEWKKEHQIDAIVGAVKTLGMTNFLTAIEEKYREEELKQKIRTVTDLYRNSDNLAQATRQLMNALFGAYGLVIIDGDDAELKQLFIPIAEKELQESVVKQKVSETNLALEEAGYHQQVFVRDCNLFYINQDKKRIRIAKENDSYVIDGAQKTAEELIAALHKNPERFSPNALMRPLYQEAILPNLAYVGGGGEIAYWLQLKTTFNELDIPMPLLRVRDSFILLNSRSVADLETLQIPIPKLKLPLHDLVKEIALKDVAVEIELAEEVEKMDAIKAGVVQKAEQINKGLVGLVEAEFVKMQKSIERIEAKLIKAEKAKHEQKANKIQKLKDKIFPNSGFQERYENFLPYFLSESNFISKIVDNLKAADAPQIHVLEL